MKFIKFKTISSFTQWLEQQELSRLLDCLDSILSTSVDEAECLSIYPTHQHLQSNTVSDQHFFSEDKLTQEPENGECIDGNFCSVINHNLNPFKENIKLILVSKDDFNQCNFTGSVINHENNRETKEDVLDNQDLYPNHENLKNKVNSTLQINPFYINQSEIVPSMFEKDLLKSKSIHKNQIEPNTTYQTSQTLFNNQYSQNDTQPDIQTSYNRNNNMYKQQCYQYNAIEMGQQNHNMMNNNQMISEDMCESDEIQTRVQVGYGRQLQVRKQDHDMQVKDDMLIERFLKMCQAHLLCSGENRVIKIPKEFYQWDWYCKVCSNINLNFRRACRLCKVTKTCMEVLIQIEPWDEA